MTYLKFVCPKQYTKHTASLNSMRDLAHYHITHDLGDSKISNKQNRNLILLEKRSMVLLFIQKRCVQIFPAYDIERLWSFFETVIVLKPTRTHAHTLQHIKHRKVRPNPLLNTHPTPHPSSLCILTALSISLGNKYVRNRKWESCLTWKDQLKE